MNTKQFTKYEIALSTEYHTTILVHYKDMTEEEAYYKMYYLLQSRTLEIDACMIQNDCWIDLRNNDAFTITYGSLDAMGAKPWKKICGYLLSDDHYFHIHMQKNEDSKRIVEAETFEIGYGNLLRFGYKGNELEFLVNHDIANYETIESYGITRFNNTYLSNKDKKQIKSLH